MADRSDRGARRSASRLRHRDGTLDVRVRRLRFAVILAVLAAIAAYLGTGASSSTSGRGSSSGTGRRAAASVRPQDQLQPGAADAKLQARTTATAAMPTAAAPARVHPRSRRPHTIDPGTLPQTDQRPPATSPGFRAQMRALWRGIQRDSVHEAMPAFFPERAYEQLKAIGDAAGDFQGRLVGDFGLDIGAAHALLSAGAPSARLLSVEVPESYAHPVPPGVCYNSVSYYEVPNARIVYRENGGVHSFGIASMISWRGVWYVIHLGAILRPTVAGVVDDPSTGPGSSACSGTC